MGILENYEPRAVWDYFEKICSIPHGSGNTDAISDYCVEFAKEHNLEVIQDELKNVIIIKEATPGYEKEAPIILQGHVDMVCEKRLESDFNFTTDGLKLETDGEYVWAKDTTLGGDDGIAVAYALAILASDEIAHPRLEVVLTVDEEVGLEGAFAIDLSMLKGRKLINIDSEEEGYVWVSCAGGLRFDAYIPVEYNVAEGVICDIAVTGLLGGHSGSDIQTQHANANQLMGRLLYTVQQKMSVKVVALDCGSKDNAIPRHTTATVMLRKEDIQSFQNELSVLEVTLKKEYESSDAGVHILCDVKEVETKKVLVKESMLKVLNVLMNFPNGIQVMSKDIEGLVETSTNMGPVKLDENQCYFSASQRSSKNSAKEYLSVRSALFIEQLGGTHSIRGCYPGWTYKKESELRDTIVEVYEEMHGTRPNVQAIHAGLECGILSDKVEGLDCVSIGPDMFGVHTYEERLSLKSTKRTWELLLEVLKKHLV